ncbi:MAG TPA: Gfo/Idh/MocA family oxidoreductase [Candidatus Limnocylindrales bacterium]|nr:Gfo/Idh/MocA family oxidoreductase [Candidatus Limnocylindrales bacterium]
MSAPRPVRWGFLGAGFVASRGMAPAVHAASGAVLQAVGARDAARAEALQPAGGVGSYADICARDDVDAVYVSLPNDDHLHWVLHALEAGKHVLCEKPLGMNADEVGVMRSAAEGRGLLLVEAAWNRWHPRTRRIEALVAGVTGPREVRAWFTFPGVPSDNYRLDPARGGGALLDVGCYAVSAALAALTADVVGIGAVERHLGPTGVDLTTSAVLTHANGSATITASFERPESQGLTIEAPGVSVEFGGQAFTTWREPCVLRVVQDGDLREEQFAACDPYQVMVEAVSARIRGEDAWVLPLVTSAAVAATVDAIAQSPSAGG